MRQRRGSVEESAWRQCDRSGRASGVAGRRLNWMRAQPCPGREQQSARVSRRSRPAQARRGIMTHGKHHNILSLGRDHLECTPHCTCYPLNVTHFLAHFHLWFNDSTFVSLFIYALRYGINFTLINVTKISVHAWSIKNVVK